MSSSNNPTPERRPILSLPARPPTIYADANGIRPEAPIGAASDKRALAEALLTFGGRNARG